MMARLLEVIIMTVALEELPEIREQKRPRYIPKSIINSSIQVQHARGIDTETLDGKCYLITFEKAKQDRKTKLWELYPVAHYTNSFEDVLNAVLEGGRSWFKGGKNGFTHPDYFFWNLKFDAQAILKHLPNEIIDLVYLNKTVSINYQTFTIVDSDDVSIDHSKTVEIFYLPKKCLRFSFHKEHGFIPTNSSKEFNGGIIEFWDAMQFYGGSLNKNSKKFLGDNKTELCFDGSKMDVSKLGDEVMVKVKHPQGIKFEKVIYHDYYKEDIEFYALKDAVLAGRLIRKKLEEFVGEDVQFRNPYSIASIAQTDLMFKGYKEIIPDSVKYELELRIAKTAYHGGHFEAAEVGRIDGECVYWDLKSAYLYSQYHLPSMTRWKPVLRKDGIQKVKLGQPLFEAELRGKFVMQSDEADGNPKMVRNELLSIAEPRINHSPIFLHVDAEFVEGMKWNPLCYVGQYGSPLTTPREFSGWITYDEYKEALKWPHHYINANCFSAWVDDEESTKYPFRDFIDYWFDVKESKDPSDPAYSISKSLAVSPYGKTIQDIEGKSGQLYHPHYAAITTGICRASLMRFIRYNDFKAVMVATDGILIRSKDCHTIPKRYLDARSNLGEWELEAKDMDAVVLMSGVYGFVDRTPTTKKASFKVVDNRLTIEEELTHKTVSKERGSASYFRNKSNGESWFDFLVNNKDEAEVTTTINRPYSLGQARRIIKERLENGDYEKKAIFDLMNIFDEQEFTLKACADSSKRKYHPTNRPKTFGDLLNNCYQLENWDSFHQVDYILSGGKNI